MPLASQVHNNIQDNSICNARHELIGVFHEVEHVVASGNLRMKQGISSSFTMEFQWVFLEPDVGEGKKPFLEPDRTRGIKGSKDQ
jgi:hypothetical protein